MHIFHILVLTAATEFMLSHLGEQPLLLNNIPRFLQ